MEFLDIVDANNQLTGRSEERNKAHELGLYHRHVSCWIMNQKGEILLQKRAGIKKKNPNRWAKTGGHVDSGETPEMALIREIKEELGIEISKENMEFLSLYKSSENTCFGYEYLIYVRYKENEFRLQEEELSEVKYYTIEQIEDHVRNKDKEYTFVDWKDGELFNKTAMLKQKREKLLRSTGIC